MAPAAGDSLPTVSWALVGRDRAGASIVYYNPVTSHALLDCSHPRVTASTNNTNNHNVRHTTYTLNSNSNELLP